MPTSINRPINDTLVVLGKESGEDEGTIKDKCQLGSDSQEEMVTGSYFLMEPRKQVSCSPDERNGGVAATGNFQPGS